MNPARFIFLAGILAAVLTAQALGATPSVETRIQTAQIYEGETIAYEIAAKNVPDDARPDLTDFKTDFEIVERERVMEPRGSVRIVVNGRDMSPKDDTVVYRYQLTPKRAGALTVPAPFFIVDGKKISGQPQALKVIADEKQDYVIVRIETDKQRVVPYKPFEVTIKILVKPMSVDDRDPLNFISPPRIKTTWKTDPAGLKGRGDLRAWLSPLISESGRGWYIDDVANDFGQLVAFRLNTGREKHKGLDGKDYNYFVYQLRRTFTPQRAGTFEFGPVTIKGEFFEGLMADRVHFSTRPVYAVASAAKVEAVLPEPRPANFNGCYGPYKLRASSNAKSLRVGDPLTLKLEFEKPANGGMLEDVSAPDLTTNPKLMAAFALVDKSPPGQTEGNVKSYSYVLRPKKAGVSIPPIDISIFDIQGEKYETLASDAIPLNVTEAPQLRADEVISGAAATSGRTIGGRENGVFQNVADASEISKLALNPMLYLAAVAGLWLFYGIGLGALTIHRQRSGDAVLQRRLRARAEASTQLDAARAALKSNDAKAAALGVQRALTGLIGNWSGVSPAGMTSADAALALEKFGASKEARNETVRIMESIEASHYGALAGMEAAALVESAEKLLPWLQKEMERTT